MAITISTPVFTASSTGTAISLSWEAAVGTGAISYLVYYIPSVAITDLDTIAKCQSVGILWGAAQTGTNVTITGLSTETDYVVNIVPLENGISEDTVLYTPKIVTTITTTISSATLKEEYLEGENGYTAKMAAVFNAGVAFVANNRNAILSNLQTAASKGKKSFTSSHVVTFEPANLRLQGTHMNTYFAGIIKGFADENIYSYEVAPALDTTDTNDTYVILTFSL